MIHLNVCHNSTTCGKACRYSWEILKKIIALDIIQTFEITCISHVNWSNYSEKLTCVMMVLKQVILHICLNSTHAHACYIEGTLKDI